MIQATKILNLNLRRRVSGASNLKGEKSEHKISTIAPIDNFDSKGRVVSTDCAVCIKNPRIQKSRDRKLQFFSQEWSETSDINKADRHKSRALANSDRRTDGPTDGRTDK